MTTHRAGHLPAAAKRFLMWDPNPSILGVTMPFPTPNAMPPDRVRAMLIALADNHETLRGRYSYGMDAAWEILPPSDIEEPAIDFRTVDIEDVPGAEIGALIERETVAANARLDPPSGRIISATLFTRVADGNILLLTVHHVACDAVALWILWGDMATYVQQWESGAPIELLPESTTCSDWATFLTEHSKTRAGEADYWFSTSDSEPYSPDRPDSPDPVYLDGVIDGELSARLFDELPAAYDATHTRIMLVALGLAVEDVLGVPRPIQVQKHGRYARLRPGTDLGRTVGWLSDDYPWLLAAIPGSHGERLRHAIAEYPASPEDFTLLRWYNADLAEQFLTFNHPKYYFNFVGDIGGYVPGSRSRELARMTVFDLSMLLGGYREDGVRKVHYSVHSPRGGIGEKRVNEIVTQWLSILESVELP